MIKAIIPVALCFSLVACSNDESPKGEHVWKEQTDAIKKAEQVEDQIMQAAKVQQQTIEDIE